MAGFGPIATFPIAAVSSPSVSASLGIASETDSALSLLMPGIAEESDSTFSVSVVRTYAVGIATETDRTFSLSYPLGIALETDEALSARPLGVYFWPVNDLKPRHIGIYPCAATIGGGIALTGKEPAIDSGAGYWRIEYGSVRLRNRDDILTWREWEAITEGRGKLIAIPVFDGKRAPWPGGIAGATIDIEANAAASTGDTSIELLVNDAADPEVGMHFSAGYWMYRLKTVTDMGGGVFACTIWPKLRADIAAAEALNFSRPLLRVRLETDDAMALDLRLLKFGDPDVTFVEAL